jgi:hypothetical protein
VDELQGVLALLKDSHFIFVEGSYPFEEVQLQGEPDGGTTLWQTVLDRCAATGTPLETAVVDLQFRRLFAS